MLLHPVYIETNGYNMMAFVNAGPIIPDDAKCIVILDTVQGTNGFRDVSDAVHLIRTMVANDTYPQDLTGKPLDCYSMDPDMDPDPAWQTRPTQYNYWDLTSMATRVIDLTEVLAGYTRAYGTMC